MPEQPDRADPSHAPTMAVPALFALHLCREALWLALYASLALASLDHLLIAILLVPPLATLRATLNWQASPAPHAITDEERHQTAAMRSCWPFPPVLLLSPTYTFDRYFTAVLAHELGHAHRRDDRAVWQTFVLQWTAWLVAIDLCTRHTGSHLVGFLLSFHSMARTRRLTYTGGRHGTSTPWTPMTGHRHRGLRPYRPPRLPARLHDRPPPSGSACAATSPPCRQPPPPPTRPSLPPAATTRTPSSPPFTPTPPPATTTAALCYTSL